MTGRYDFGGRLYSYVGLLFDSRASVEYEGAVHGGGNNARSPCEMGCGGTKQQDPLFVIPDSPAVGKAEGKVKGARERYHSDVRNSVPAFTASMVHKHEYEDLERIYDVKGGVTLGAGASGSVVAIRKRATGEQFAMKIIPANDSQTLEDIRAEIAVQRRLDHPNIVKVFEHFENRAAQNVYLTMEMCSGGSLVSSMRSHRHGYGERAVATMMEKMLSAVIYCHNHGVGKSACE